MGETVPLESDDEEVTIIVKVWQGKGSDGDDTKEGPYTIRIISDPDGVGGRQASQREEIKHVKENTETRIPITVAAGEYIYLEVKEENGKDNPVGDGGDEFNNATGEIGSDNKRDDLNDSAWTAPIWFAKQQSGRFVWSRRSSLYHDRDCWAVKLIGKGNRVDSNTAPSGKRKHSCRNHR
jgi:hypothetical protein